MRDLASVRGWGLGFGWLGTIGYIIVCLDGKIVYDILWAKSTG